MKRLVSMALAVMLLMSTISGVGTVFAEETASTTLQEWMFYDFEGTRPDWVETTATSAVYDIGTYRNDWRVETLNLNGTAGIEKTDGLTMEVEFDCKIGDLLNNGTKGGGVLYVSTGAGETPTDKRYENFYGSVAAVNDSVTDGTGFSTWTNNYAKVFGSAELDKWYRVKMVMPIGDEVQTYSVYVDGVIINSRTQAGVSATDVVKFLCIEASGANSCIDNLRVVTYTAAKDAPVDKGALVAAIRDFEEEYLGYATVETAAKNIEEVKAVYKNTAATAEEVAEAIGKINETKTILDSSTTLQEWMFYDFEGTKPDWVETTATSAVYDIGTYRNDWRVETLNLNGTAGIEKTDGLTMEVEFDCKIGDLLNNGIKGGGVLYVSTGEGETPATPGYSNFYGSVAAVNNSETNVACFDTWNNNYNKAFGSAELDKWYRVKMVMPIDDTAKTYSVYVDGVKMNPRTQAGVSATDVVKFLCIEASGANSCIDNLRVVTYTAAKDAPVDKGALIAAIRDFEEEYPGYAGNAKAAEIIREVKATYKKEKATTEEVTAAIAKIDEAKTAIDTYTTFQEWMFYDFEGTKPDWVEDTATSAVYDIGTYRNDWRTETLNLNGATGIEKIAGLTMEVEFDCKIGDLLNNSKQGGATLYVSTGAGESPTGKGYENYYGAVAAINDTDTERNGTGFSTWHNNYTKAFGSAELDKWYRVKMVMPIGDTRQTYSVYVDGVKTKSVNQQGVSATDVVKFLCIEAGSANSCIDNLRVVTYTDAKDAPAEKGVLIAAIRDFEETYPSYAENTVVAEYISAAKEIYKKDDATAEEVAEAKGLVTRAERTLFNAEPLVKEKFDSKPAYFFDAVNDVSYTESSALPTRASYIQDATYDITSALTLTSGSATKNFSETALASVEYITAEVDVKTSGTVSVALSDSVKYELSGEGIWKRVRFDIDTIHKTYNVYVNGEKVITDNAISENSLSKLTITSDSEYSVDNLVVYSFENAKDVVSDKGGLVKELRTSKALLDAGTMTKDEAALMKTILDKCGVVYNAPVALSSDIAAAIEKAAFYNKTLPIQMEGAKSIVIPGIGKEVNDSVVKMHLHYGSQLGDEAYNEVFFDKGVSTDFSDVRFYNTDGQEIQSHIESSGNYEMVKDSNLSPTYEHYMSDGTIVSRYQGRVAFYNEEEKKWEPTSFITNSVVFVDRNDNVYFAKYDEINGPGALYKMYKDEEGNWQEKCVISNADLIDMETTSGEKVTGTSVIWHRIVQDDDGYIYAGRYQYQWSGAAVFVSDESGENFRLVDFRTDKQHVHSISINKNVYPNEVYVCMDDTMDQPLCYMSTDRFGYEEIKDLPEHQLPVKARCTGASSNPFHAIDSEHPEYQMPKNEAAEIVMANAKKHSTQVPIPYHNSDYLNYFGLIQTRDEAPEKFYQEENGKWYTIKDKEYYDEVGGETLKYSSNIYALGGGEGNILGGATVYKTTDIMDPDKYYGVIETLHSIRRIISPKEGTVVVGGLAGGYENSIFVAVSYDDGETWTTALDYGAQVTADNEIVAGWGSFEYLSEGYERSDGAIEFLGAGIWDKPSMRYIFGGDNYMGLSSVVIPKLPEDGLKIFVKTDGDGKAPVTSYNYDDGAIKSTKTEEGNGEVLKFPLLGDAKNMVYSFDIQSENNTGIEVNILASNSKGINPVLKAFVNKADGSVTLNDGEKVTCSVVSEADKFSLKLMTDEAGGADLYINDSLICTGELLDKYENLSAMTIETVDVSGGDAPSVNNPVTVNYSNVGYGEYTPAEAQFILEKVAMTKDGDTTEIISKGTVVESVSVKKLDVDIDNAKLIIALYNDQRVLQQTEIIDVDGSGTYPVNMTAESDGLVMKTFIFKDEITLRPLSLAYGTEAETIEYDISGTAGSEVISQKAGNMKPYSDIPKIETPFYYHNNGLSPVFRLKFDEGSGNTVKDTVSGKSFEINGTDYEWIDDANIRYGTILPLSIRQKSALRLNNSYIDLGEVANLANVDGEYTIILWTNFEIFGRNDDFVEEKHSQYTGFKTYGVYKSAYKYDKNRKNVIFQSDNAKIAIAGAYNGPQLKLDGLTSKTIGFGEQAVGSDFYNMYTITVKKNENGEWIVSYNENANVAADSRQIVLEDYQDVNPFGGNLYVGTPSPDGTYASMELGIADLMVFDRALTYQERLEIYNGYKEPVYFDTLMGTR